MLYITRRKLKLVVKPPITKNNVLNINSNTNKYFIFNENIYFINPPR